MVTTKPCFTLKPIFSKHRLPTQISARGEAVCTIGSLVKLEPINGASGSRFRELTFNQGNGRLYERSFVNVFPAKLIGVD